MALAKDHRTGITISDLKEARQILDDLALVRARHAFRFDNANDRWELYTVAPANRTIRAYQNDTGGWTVI